MVKRQVDRTLHGQLDWWVYRVSFMEEIIVLGTYFFAF